MARVLIVNPYASGVTPARVEAVASALGDVEVRRTERPGHATDLAREAAAGDVFVFSGDGGFNEVLNGLAARSRLGLIPGGGANVLPRALGIPRDPVEAARRVRDGVERRISVGRVNGRRFGFAAGFGFDAEVVRRVDRLGRTEDAGRAGNLRFAWTLARLVAERRARFEPIMEIDGYGRAAFALVANGDPYTYAGVIPLHVSGTARFELGLDLLAPRRVTPSSVPSLLGAVVRGTGNGNVIRVHDADRIEIRVSRSLPLHADGEDLGDADNVLFEAERNAVTVLV